MSERSRRWLLGATGMALAASAGCIEINTGGGDSPNTPTESNTLEVPDKVITTEEESFDPDDFRDSVPTEAEQDNQIDLPDDAEPVSRTLIDDIATVSEDDYVYYNFTLDLESRLSLNSTVRSGPAVDIILTSQREFNQYQAGNRFRYNSGLSQLDTIGETTSTVIPSGDMVLIVDNTSAGEAQPPTNFDDDVASVELTLTSTPI